MRPLAESQWILPAGLTFFEDAVWRQKTTVSSMKASYLSTELLELSFMTQSASSFGTWRQCVLVVWAVRGRVRQRDDRRR